MNITLYKTSSENERVDKSLTSSLSLTGTLKDKTDVINPVVLIGCLRHNGYHQHCYVECSSEVNVQ